jgi:hypothetical protein
VRLTLEGRRARRSRSEPPREIRQRRVQRSESS